MHLSKLFPRDPSKDEVRGRVLKSVFQPDVCCEHDWSTQDFTDLGVPEEDHVWECEDCGATCRRDADGKITSYNNQPGRKAAVYYGEEDDNG